jgi:putative DNA primase/helicase
MLTQNAVREVQGFVQAPIEMVAMSALSAMSAALQAHRDVRRSSKLVGPISLWHLTVAESGERKTSLDRYFSDAIRDYERRKAKAAAPDIQKAKDQAENWAAQKKGLLAALTKASKAGADTSEIEQELEELRANAPITPRVPLILRGDDTSESLAYALSHDWPSAAVLNSEAGLIFGSHAMGPEKVMAALAQKNVFWDGGDFHIGRRTSESFTVRGARFTFGLQIQRAALSNFVQKNGEPARGIGFWARFLFAEPESTQGTRLWKEPPKTWAHLARFKERLALLLDIDPVFDALGLTLRPPFLDLSPGGKAAWVEVYNSIEIALAFDRPFTEIKDVASKAADNVARLAALFHIFELGLEGEIESGQVAAAAKIIDWHLNESRRFFGSLQLSEADRDAADLEEWLVKYCCRFFVTSVARSEVQKGINPRRLREGKVLDAAIEKLQGVGRVRLIQDGKQKLIQVRPELLTPKLQAAEWRPHVLAEAIRVEGAEVKGDSLSNLRSFRSFRSRHRQLAKTPGKESYRYPATWMIALPHRL